MFSILAVIVSVVSGQEPSAEVLAFASTWRVRAGQTLELPAMVGVLKSAPVDWGDNSTPVPCPTLPSPCAHEYQTDGIVSVTTFADLTGWTMANAAQTTRDSLLAIESWGNLMLNPQSGQHFYNCTQLTSLPSYPPPASYKLASLDHSFSLARSLDSGAIGQWDISGVTTLRGVFAKATKFNQDLSAWDTTRVLDATGAFLQAESFNSPLANWSLANLIDASAMFSQATSFNQPLQSWKLPSLRRANAMFMGAAAFDQDLSAWSLNPSLNCQYFAWDSKLQPTHYPRHLPSNCL